MTTELTPEFAVTVRGYDRVQVDDYVDALRDWLGNAAARMETAEAEAAHLGEQVLLLRTRLAQLDQQASGTPPRTIAALGDRVTRILQLAEEGALAVRADADAEALAIVGRGRQEAEELSRVLRSKEAEVEAVMVNASAEAAKVVAQAEARAHELVQAAEAERSSVLAQLRDQRARIDGELQTLASERDEVVDGLNKLREALHRTIADVLPAPAPQPAPAEPVPASGVAPAVFDREAGQDQ